MPDFWPNPIRAESVEDDHDIRTLDLIGASGQLLSEFNRQDFTIVGYGVSLRRLSKEDKRKAGAMGVPDSEEPVLIQA
jgi:hypothetical protein